MFSLLNTDDKVLHNSKKTKELSIEVEQHENQIDDFLKEINLTPKQAEIYLSNQANFSEDEWAEIEKQRKILNEKLIRDLENIRNPEQTKKSFSSLNVDQNWLFVR